MRKSGKQVCEQNYGSQKFMKHIMGCINYPTNRKKIEYLISQVKRECSVYKVG